jgi:hypothetical protein
MEQSVHPSKSRVKPATACTYLTLSTYSIAATASQSYRRYYTNASVHRYVVVEEIVLVHETLWHARAVVFHFSVKLELS